MVSQNPADFLPCPSTLCLYYKGWKFPRPDSLAVEIWGWHKLRKDLGGGSKEDWTDVLAAARDQVQFPGHQVCGFTSRQQQQQKQQFPERWLQLWMHDLELLAFKWPLTSDPVPNHLKSNCFGLEKSRVVSVYWTKSWVLTKDVTEGHFIMLSALYLEGSRPRKVPWVLSPAGSVRELHSDSFHNDLNRESIRNHQPRHRAF